ncbi:tonB1 protein [Vibrio mimicus]|nr:energy transducer TonB [Vibrio mimicus]EMB50629.1 Ferric siderophore transport system, periplasmic binding protein TonB [Vibrio mimicus CAIM 602]MBY7675528.1 energy transducer TonB [Vibrio mimicus]MBY7727226.1 energy transducer TonB [Vibrio mimicus]TXY30023.1 energy transducer TonB [Vibrio mimicus]SUQ23154.1 tonB1 protein [Vibrio mimicus]
MAFHALLLITTDEAQVFAMPAGNPSQYVSLNMVAMPKSAPAPTDPVKPSPPQKQVKPEPVLPKAAVKPKPQPQATKNPVPVEQAKQAPAAKPVPEKVETNTQNEPKTQQTAAKPTTASKGVSSQPILVDKPAFVSAPVQPRYPRVAQKRGIEGTVMYEIWLDEQGNQIQQYLITSSGTEVLDKSALEAIKQWKFSPRILDGVPVAHRVHIPVRFKLEG